MTISPKLLILNMCSKPQARNGLSSLRGRGSARKALTELGVTKDELASPSPRRAVSSQPEPLGRPAHCTATHDPSHINPLTTGLPCPTPFPALQRDGRPSPGLTGHVPPSSSTFYALTRDRSSPKTAVPVGWGPALGWSPRRRRTLASPAGQPLTRALSLGPFPLPGAQQHPSPTHTLSTHWSTYLGLEDRERREGRESKEGGTEVREVKRRWQQVAWT